LNYQALQAMWLTQALVHLLKVKAITDKGNTVKIEQSFYIFAICTEWADADLFMLAS